MPEVIMVTIQPDGGRIHIAPGESLLDAGRKLYSSGGTSIEAPCGGKGICGRCRVLVTEGRMEPPTEAEKTFLAADELAGGWRLACLAVPSGPVRIEIPPESMTLRADLQVAGPAISVDPDPLVKRRAVELRATTIRNPASLWRQIEKALAKDGEPKPEPSPVSHSDLARHAGGGSRTADASATGAADSGDGAADRAADGGVHRHLDPPRPDAELVRRLDPNARDGHCVVSVTGRTVTNLYLTSPAPPPVGLAVDLGTTKVAGYLVDLETGDVLAANGVMNPQIHHGADVVTRITHALESPSHAARLSELARECINHLARLLTERRGLESRHVEQVVVAGNTLMHHLLLSWPVAQLAHAPYVPASTAPVEVKARELGLDCAPGASIYLIPPIAGYVGGDHTAMILACRIHEATAGITLGLDIGTNTEIVLSDRGKLSCCSCASGPAFEGAHISQGVRAVEGAVHQVRLDGDGGVSYKTIGEKPPLGLCGSGIVNGVAELVRWGIVNELGIMNRNHPRVRINQHDGAPEFLLAEAADSGARRDLVLTQKDVCAIQLAKAAIASGIEALLESAGMEKTAIEKVFVAGAFGTQVDLESTVTLGLLPDLPRERFSQVGNAAGTGAGMVLISARERREAEALARRAHYLELAAHPRFGKLFSGALRFPRPKS